jgi:hypothetical protein
LIANLDGCSGQKAGRISAQFKGVACSTVTRDQAVGLLRATRAESRQVRPERLGAVGPLDELGSAYVCERGVFVTGGREPKAEVPFVVEVWARAHKLPGLDEDINVWAGVNRTPATGDIYVFGSKKQYAIYGYGLGHDLDIPKGVYDITIGVMTPYCPITTDGKEPDLSPFARKIVSAVNRAVRKARRTLPNEAKSTLESRTQKTVILANLRDGIAKASGGGCFCFNLRQLFYVIRPHVAQAFGAELTYGNFEKVITEYEDEHGPIPNMYRDPRGALYHPHTGESIPLGTIAVEQYKRPAWTFNRLLYCEKEGLLEILRAARWPERHDCALVSSKGFTTRAVRDLLDLLGDSDEPLRVFCIHDADAYGSLIYETLVKETKARPRRRVEVANLGLEPWEAIRLGLEIEPVERKSNRRVPVAGYVLDRADGECWAEWLQDKRVELNEMTTPQFIAWLDVKMDEHDCTKIVPPEAVITAEMDNCLARLTRDQVTERILREARVDEQVASAIRLIAVPEGNTLVACTAEWVEDNPEDRWADYVTMVAEKLVRTTFLDGAEDE